MHKPADRRHIVAAEGEGRVGLDHMSRSVVTQA
jgi:hypothetical protein